MLDALAAFVGWNFLSMTWADFPGTAWTGSDKTLIYAALFALFALWRWEVPAALTVMGLFTLGVTGIGVVLLVQSTTAADPASFFQEGRLLPPIGYVNANVALWMLAFWPATFLGSVKTIAPPLRGLFLGCAALLLELSVIGESRGWLYLMPPVTVIALLLARQRLRLILALALPTAGMLAILHPLLDIYERDRVHRPIGPPLDHAARLILLTCVAVAIAGVLWGLADQGMQLARRAHLAAGLAVAVACFAVVAAGTVRLAHSINGHPQRWLDSNWSDFARGYPVDSGDGSRFTGSLGTDRYTQWRVAAIEFAHHPVAGIGSDNYEAPYVLRRQYDYVDPRYPHSTPLRLLSQLGLIGTALFTIFTGIAVWLALRIRRRQDAIGGGAAATCVTMFAYWFVHGSIDWFWEIPALAATAFAFLGLAASIVLPAEASPPRTATLRSPGLRRVGLAGGAAVAVAALLALVLPWLSFRYEMAGLAVWKNDPSAAYNRLEHAADLDPFSAEPFVIEGSIALQRGDLPVARRAFGEAINREPKGWYPYFQLGLAAASIRHYDEAAGYLRTARALNPVDTILAMTAKTVREHGTVRPDQINGLYLKDLNRRLAGNPKL